MNGNKEKIPLFEGGQIRSAFVQPGAGPKVWMSGDEYTILLDAKNSANAMTLIDAYVPPAGGPPAHIHNDVDELFVVTEGELDIMADHVVQQVKAGGCVFVRRNVPHAFFNRTNKPVRMLIFYTPAGVEEFFLAAGKPTVEGVEPPPVDEVSTAQEIEVASHYNIINAKHEAGTYQNNTEGKENVK